MHPNKSLHLFEASFRSLRFRSDFIIRHSCPLWNFDPSRVPFRLLMQSNEFAREISLHIHSDSSMWNFFFSRLKYYSKLILSSHSPRTRTRHSAFHASVVIRVNSGCFEHCPSSTTDPRFAVMPHSIGLYYKLLSSLDPVDSKQRIRESI